jgi:hypothetical protein
MAEQSPYIPPGQGVVVTHVPGGGTCYSAPSYEIPIGPPPATPPVTEVSQSTPANTPLSDDVGARSVYDVDQQAWVTR